MKTLFKLSFRRRDARKGAAHGTVGFLLGAGSGHGGVGCRCHPRPGRLRPPGAVFPRWPGDGVHHTGTGKGPGVVVPTLLTYPGSMVVTDPKGENFAITKRHRATLGKVLVLNPLELGKSDCFNPMDVIRRGSPMEVDAAAALARIMVRPDAREAHWDDKAMTAVKCLVLHALHQPPEHWTLAYVRTLSSEGGLLFMETVSAIAKESPSLATRDLALRSMQNSAPAPRHSPRPERPNQPPESTSRWIGVGGNVTALAPADTSSSRGGAITRQSHLETHIATTVDTAEFLYCSRTDLEAKCLHRCDQ